MQTVLFTYLYYLAFSKGEEEREKEEEEEEFVA